MNANMHKHTVKRMSLTVQKAVTTTGKGGAGRRAKGGHEEEAER